MISKEELHKKAKKLNVNIEGLPWPQQVNAVKEAEQKKKSNKKNDETEALKQQLAEARSQLKNMQVKYENHEKGSIPDRADYEKQPIMIAPEMTPNRSDPSLSRYSNIEKLNPNLEIEEVNYGLQDFGPKSEGEKRLHGSYRIKGRTNQTVTAYSRGPRFQPGIYWNGPELWEEVSFQGRKGYLWSDVRAHLKTVHGGKYLKKYEENIKENLLPIGHRLAIEKEFTEYLISSIEDEEALRKKRGY